MFSKEVSTLSNEPGVFANAIQETPSRISIYGINRCEDQVIGFEFVTKELTDNPKCCSNNIIHLCVPIEVLAPITLEASEFWVTDDPCYQDWIVKKIEEPFIEIQRDDDENATGVLVRFSKYETCCYPLQAAFKLYATNSEGCRYSLASGLLIFR